MLAVGVPIMQAAGEPERGDRKEVNLWHSVMLFPISSKREAIDHGATLLSVLPARNAIGP